MLMPTTPLQRPTTWGPLSLHDAWLVRPFLRTHWVRNRWHKSVAGTLSVASKKIITATLKTCPKKAKPFVRFWTNGLTPAFLSLESVARGSPLLLGRLGGRSVSVGSAAGRSVGSAAGWSVGSAAERPCCCGGRHRRVRRSRGKHVCGRCLPTVSLSWSRLTEATRLV